MGSYSVIEELVGEQSVRGRCSSVAVRSWKLRHGDNSGTQREVNVRCWKPLPGNGYRSLIRLYVCCSYNDLWSVQIIATVVVICSYDLLSVQ
jgi:hypothetical protein